MKDLKPLNFTDPRKLDKEIEQLLSDVPLAFVDEEDACLIYRDGIDDLQGVAFDALPYYSTDLNAAWSALAQMRIPATIEIKNYPDGSRLLISFWDRVWFTDSTPPPATAICNAILKWKQWQTENAVAS